MPRKPWDDVDWDKILSDELENMIDWWYTQVVRGEIDESEWDYREDFVDDEDHQQRTDEAYKNHASEKIRDMVVDEMGADPMNDEMAPGAFERVWKQIIEELQDEEHDRWEQTDMEGHHFDAYMRDYLRREEQGDVND